GEQTCSSPFNTVAQLVFNGSGASVQQIIVPAGNSLFSGSNPLDVVVNSPTIQDMGNAVINNYGRFTVNSGASLMIGNAGGIALTAASGNVQTGANNNNTGHARTFSGNTYTYYNAYGSGAQITGDALPASVANLTIGKATGDP